MVQHPKTSEQSALCLSPFLMCFGSEKSAVFLDNGLHESFNFVDSTLSCAHRPGFLEVFLSRCSDPEQDCTAVLPTDHTYPVLRTEISSDFGKI